MLASLISLCTVDAAPALPHNWWRAWSLAPAVLLPWLALSAFAGAPPQRSGLPAGRAWAMRGLGLGLLGVALISPLCRIGATLASAHMAQLMVLIAGCACLAAGWCGPAPGARRTLLMAAAGHGLLLWLWHVPAVYALSLTSGVAHLALTMALSLLSFLFFQQALHAGAAQRGAALLALLLTLMHTGLLGALLSFSGTPLYPLQAPGARAWGVMPLMDQQLAGLIMWVPGGLLYMGVALALAWRWSARAPRARPAHASA